MHLIPNLLVEATDAKKERQHSLGTMSGIYHLEIMESEAALKTLLRCQKTASDKERIQLLYLLKSEQAKTMQQAAL